MGKCFTVQIPCTLGPKLHVADIRPKYVWLHVSVLKKNQWPHLWAETLNSIQPAVGPYSRTNLSWLADIPNAGWMRDFFHWPSTCSIVPLLIVLIGLLSNWVDLTENNTGLWLLECFFFLIATRDLIEIFSPTYRYIFILAVLAIYTWLCSLLVKKVIQTKKKNI